MSAEIFAGMRLALKRWPVMITLATMVSVACLVLSLVVADVLTQAAVLRGGAQLRERQAVTFSPFYAVSGTSDVGRVATQTLMDHVEQNRAYTAIIGNVQIDDPTFADGHPVVVLIGDSVRSVFPDLHLCSPAPCAMVGHELKDEPIDPIAFAGNRFLPSAVLPPAAAFFDPNAAGLPLGRRIVLVLPSSGLSKLNAVEREEAFTKTVFLDPQSAAVDEFVTVVRSSGLVLVPNEVAISQSNSIREVMIMSAMYIAALAAFLILVLTAFTITVDQALRNERRSFLIRRMYGATSSHLGVRVGVFLFFSSVAIPLVVTSSLVLLGEPVATGARWVIVLLAIVFVALWLATIRGASLRAPLSR